MEVNLTKVRKLFFPFQGHKDFENISYGGKQQTSIFDSKYIFDTMYKMISMYVLFYRIISQAVSVEMNKIRFINCFVNC